MRLAIAWSRVAIARNPGDAGAWSRLGFNLQEIGDLKGANAALDRSLALDPTLGVTYTSKALVLPRLHGEATALHWAERASEAGDVGAGFDPVIRCLQKHQSPTPPANR